MVSCLSLLDQTRPLQMPAKPFNRIARAFASMSDLSSPDGYPDGYHGFYPYSPSKALPIVFAVLIAISLALHIFQSL